jgi:hypothetical protein
MAGKEYGILLPAYYVEHISTEYLFKKELRQLLHITGELHIKPEIKSFFFRSSFIFSSHFFGSINT